MHARNVAVLFIALILSIAVFAGEKQHMKIEIAVESDDGNTEVRFDSDDAGFNLHELEVGETRTFDTDDGGEASVTRTDSGFEFDVDGQKIDVDDMQEMHEMHVGSDTENVWVVEDAREIRVLSAEGPDNVTIVTAATLDETTKQKIRDVLAESGIGEEVVFIDGGEPGSADDAKHEKHQKVRVIKKEIDVDN